MVDSISIVIPTLKQEVELPEFLLDNEIILSNSPGRSRGRNDGALKSSKEFLLFMDDDAKFTEETYRKYILNEFEKNPSVIVSMESPVLSTRVTGISRKLFFEVGGFDETFVTAEDLDFGYRLLEKGYTIKYIPIDKIVHNEHPRPRFRVRALRSYLNSVRLLLRYKKLLIWSNKKKRSVKIPLSVINVFKVFTNAPKKGPYIPLRFIVSIFAFYYYFLFDKSIRLG